MNREHSFKNFARRQLDGFTLIEVLLAVSIFATVLLAIHTVFYGALQLRNKTTESVTRDLPMQHTLAILKRDLAHIVMPGGTFFGELQTMASMTATTNTLSWLTPAENSIPGQSSPAFFTASGLIRDDLPWGNIGRVSYYLAPPTNNSPRKVLVRSELRNLLPIFEEPPIDQPLMSGLEAIFFSFYDGMQWRDYWDSTVETNKVPLGIKVELQMAAAEDAVVRPMPIELVVPIVLLAGTNETAEATETETDDGGEEGGR